MHVSDVEMRKWRSLKSDYAMDLLQAERERSGWDAIFKLWRRKGLLATLYKLKERKGMTSLRDVQSRTTVMKIAIGCRRPLTERVPEELEGLKIITQNAVRWRNVVHKMIRNDKRKVMYAKKDKDGWCMLGNTNVTELWLGTEWMMFQLRSYHQCAVLWNKQRSGMRGRWRAWERKEVNEELGLCNEPERMEAYYLLLQAVSETYHKVQKDHVERKWEGM